MSIVLDPVTFVTFQLLLVGGACGFYLFLSANLRLLPVPLQLIPTEDNGIRFKEVMF